jgi:hypothetical protein
MSKTDGGLSTTQPRTIAGGDPVMKSRQKPASITIEGREVNSFFPTPQWVKRCLGKPDLKETKGEASMKQYRKNGREVIVIIREQGSLRAANLISENALPRVKNGAEWYLCAEGVNLDAPSKNDFVPVEDKAIVRAAAKTGAEIIDPEIGAISREAAARCIKDNPNLKLNKSRIAIAAYINLCLGCSMSKLPRITTMNLSEDLGYPSDKLLLYSENFFKLCNIAESPLDRVKAKKAKNILMKMAEESVLVVRLLAAASNDLTIESLNTVVQTTKEMNVLFVIGPEYETALDRLITSEGFVEK